MRPVSAAAKAGRHAASLRVSAAAKAGRRAASLRVSTAAEAAERAASLGTGSPRRAQRGQTGAREPGASRAKALPTHAWSLPNAPKDCTQFP